MGQSLASLLGLLGTAVVSILLGEASALRFSRPRDRFSGPRSRGRLHLLHLLLILLLLLLHLLLLLLLHLLTDLI